jgi:hypothetical protein
VKRNPGDGILPARSAGGRRGKLKLVFIRDSYFLEKAGKRRREFRNPAMKLVGQKKQHLLRKKYDISNPQNAGRQAK